MHYSIAAVPTRYAGINFRSRLEARWAAFFDLLGWDYSYEPLDLDGWIPDFILHGAKQRVLVEVKPIFDADHNLFDRLSRSAIRSGKRNDILVCGAEPIWDASSWPCSAFGWLGEYCGPEQGHGWGKAIVHSGGGLGFCHDYLSFGNRITGHHDGDSGAGSDEHDAFIAWAWTEAGNTVQWQPANDNQSIVNIVGRAVRKATR
jgi:hypothetical protein